MRIKISTASPLPKNQCWFAVNEKLENQTIHQLTKKIVDQLNLSTEAANLKLSMDGFHLLPQTKIKDLLRDGDLVSIKEDYVKKPAASKKRKSPVLPTESEQGNELDTRPVKKTKKSKSSITKDNDNVKAKKEKSASIKKVEKEEPKKQKKEKKEKKNEKTIRDTTEKPSVAKENKHQSAPFEGLDKTKKRNMRRKALKQHHRMLRDGSNTAASVSVVQTQQQPQQPVEDYAVHELHVERLNITSNNNEPSEKLLKKNKNKKKNHLKGSKAENRSHVFYQQENNIETNSGTVAMEVYDSNEVSLNSGTVAMQPLESNAMITDDNANSGTRPNLFGRAFVTSSESEPKYKGHRGPERKYPIHQVPILFYAKKPIEDNLSEVAPPIAQTTTASTVTTIATTEPLTDEPVNYDNLPIADFESNIPAIGDQLAIKTLELTANYTPEISDWKQVILKELDLPNTATFEFVQGFGKTSTKGGKFDIKKHQKKRYDDWYQEEYDQFEQAEEEQEEEADLVNEDEQEQDVFTVSVHDVFAMKSMSKE